MSQKTTSLSVGGTQVPVSIHDASDIVLSSAKLTGLVLGVVGKSLVKMVAQPIAETIQEVCVTIVQIRSDIEITVTGGRAARKFKMLAAIAEEYHKAEQGAINSPYSLKLREKLLQCMEDILYAEMDAVR